jgi:hypothetical protein
MEIVLNDDTNRRIFYEDGDFTDDVKIILDRSIDSSSSVLPTKKIHFKGCYFDKSLELRDSLENLHYEKIELIFENCYLPRDCKLLNVNNEIFSITLINSVFGDLKIENCSLKSLTISRLIFLERLLVNNSECESISIQNSLGTIFVNDNGKIKCHVRFSNDNLYVERNKVFKLYQKILDSREIDNVLYLDTNLHFNDVKSLKLGSEMSEKERKGFKIIETPQIDAPNKKEIIYYPTDEDLKNLRLRININQSKGLTETIDLKKGNYESIYIKGESDSKVNLEHIKCDKFYIHDFSSKSFNIYNLQNRNPNESKFEIKNSNFPNASFVKVKFDSFESINFYRNYLEKSTFSSCTFPKEIATLSNIHNPLEKEEDYAGLQYELFRQLKFSLTNSHNQIEALEMHHRMYNASRKRKDLRIQDQFILCLNELSNNHGTSISRAFFLSLTMILILWVSYCFFLPDAPFKIGWNGFESFKIALADFWKFTFSKSKVLTIIANPVHNLNNLTGLSSVEISSMNYLISFVSRILIAWGYFQFVSAFRKFGKT